MNPDGPLESAQHWETLAACAESKAAWDRAHGYDMSPAGCSAGDYQAQTYRQTARALRLEAETGLPHCAEHDTPQPRRDCSHGGAGIRLATR